MSDELDTELSKGIYVNIGGSWYKAFSEWNEATGGSVTDVDNYNGTGQKWRVHTFTSSGTFTVQTANRPWDITIVAGGGGGGAPFAGQPGWCGGGGGGYTARSIASGTFTGAVAVTVGGGSVFPNQGGDTTVAGFGHCGGGGAGWRGDGYHNTSPGRPGTWGGSSTGGTAEQNINNFTPWPSQNIRPPQGGSPPVGNAGRGGAAGYDSEGTRPGTGGYVCIAYQIG